MISNCNFSSQRNKQINLVFVINFDFLKIFKNRIFENLINHKTNVKSNDIYRSIYSFTVIQVHVL